MTTFTLVFHFPDGTRAEQELSERASRDLEALATRLDCSIVEAAQRSIKRGPLRS